MEYDGQVVRGKIYVHAKGFIEFWDRRIEIERGTMCPQDYS